MFISTNIYTTNSPQALLGQGIYLPHPNIVIKDLINSSSRRCWVNINFNETALPDLELGDSLKTI